MESDETEVLKFKLNSCRYQERQQERISMFWEKKTKIRKHIIFYGRVQGVGFRYYAVQKANQLGLTGWVRNCWDETVETGRINRPAYHFFAEPDIYLDRADRCEKNSIAAG